MLHEYPPPHNVHQHNQPQPHNDLIQLQLQLHQQVQHIHHMQPPPPIAQYPPVAPPFTTGFLPHLQSTSGRTGSLKSGGAGGRSGGATSAAATAQRAALGIKKDAVAGKVRIAASAAADGQRVWDGRQFRVIKRCPHGKVRKDLCKPCGGSGLLSLRLNLCYCVHQCILMFMP